MAAHAQRAVWFDSHGTVILLCTAVTIKAQMTNAKREQIVREVPFEAGGHCPVIELASADELAAQRALWLIENPDREPSTCNKWKKWAYTDERNRELKRIAAEYRLSEKRRKAAISARRQKARKLDEEDKRFTRIFKEKFEDKHYYGVRPT